MRIYYESRLVKVGISEEGQDKSIIDEEFDEDSLTETQKICAKWTRIENLVGTEERIKTVARDVVTHFSARLELNAGQGKGMIVCMSRRIAAELYKEIVASNPNGTVMN